jgi:hypothetical protein
MSTEQREPPVVAEAPEGAAHDAAQPKGGRPAGSPSAELAVVPPPPPSLATKRRSVRAKIVGLATVLVALVVPALLTYATESVAASGVTGFLALFVATLSVLVAALGFALSRERPRALGIVVLASLLGALALGIGGIGARLAVRAASLDAADDPTALAAWRVSVATGDARIGAWLALTGLVGAALGAWGVYRVVGARKRALVEAKHLAAGSAPSAQVTRGQVAAAWATFAGVVSAGVGGLVADVSVLAEPYEPITHPNEARLRDVATLARMGESDALCVALEEVLAPDFAPEALLDQTLSGRREIAHRCVTRAIDALPSGLPCMLEASKLSQSRTVQLVGAEDRIVSACKRSLVP